MRITGLDLATRLCGWCTGAGDSVPKADAWKLPAAGEDIGYMLDVLDQCLEHHIERFAPELIVFEAPILVVNKGEGQWIKGRFVPGRGYTDSLEKIRKLYNLAGHVEFVARRRGIECAEVHLKTIKKEVTGNANAEKGDMIDVAVRCGIELPEFKVDGRADAADAWGAWLCGVHDATPQFRALWDRRLYRSRAGGLL